MLDFMQVQFSSDTQDEVSCGSHDDSLSWNLSRVKQGGAFRADDMDHEAERAGRAVCHILASAR